MTKQLRYLLGVNRLNALVSGIVLGWFSLAAMSAEDPQLEHHIPKPMIMGIKHFSYDYAQLGNSPAEVAYHYTKMKMPVGKFDVMDQILVPTVSIERNHFRVNNITSAEPTVYTIKTEFTFIKKQDQQWVRILQIAPSIHSDLKNLSRDSFSVLGLAMWRYQISHHGSWLMGFGFNQVFGSYRPVPVLSYEYKVTDRLKVKAGFPSSKAEFSFKPNLNGFISLAPEGGNWGYESQNNGKLAVSYTSWVASSGIRYQFKKNVWGTLELGRSMQRVMNLDDASQDTEVNLEDSSALIFSIGLHP